MKSYIIPVLALGLILSSASAQDKPDLTNPKQKTSYAVGVDIATALKRQDLDLDVKALTFGISDGLAGKPALTEEQQKAALMDLEKSLRAKAEEKQKAAGEKNLKAGEDFLAANAKKDGVKTTASGLQYKVIKTGTGATPKPTDTVKVHYQGTLIDGTVFDSSMQRGEPATFPVRGVISGWTEALQLMKVGDKWQLFIPTKLAYGEDGSGPIGPNSALIFEIELLGIEKPGAGQ
jgi:FKBP-type peptidyl-prolyl cis-trans isomerase FklB